MVKEVNPLEGKHIVYSLSGYNGNNGKINGIALFVLQNDEMILLYPSPSQNGKGILNYLEKNEIREVYSPSVIGEKPGAEGWFERHPSPNANGLVERCCNIQKCGNFAHALKGLGINVLEYGEL